MPHPERAARRLAADRESFLEQFLDIGIVRESLPEFVRLAAEGRIVETLQIRLQCVDRGNPRQHPPDVPLVFGAEDLLQNEIKHVRRPLYRRASAQRRSQALRGARASSSRGLPRSTHWSRIC